MLKKLATAVAFAPWAGCYTAVGYWVLGFTPDHITSHHIDCSSCVSVQLGIWEIEKSPIPTDHEHPRPLPGFSRHIAAALTAARISSRWIRSAARISRRVRLSMLDALMAD